MAGLRIPVTVRSDRRMFAGNVEVTVEKPRTGPYSGRLKRPPPWTLTEETALSLGLAVREYLRGKLRCNCKSTWQESHSCTDTDRSGKPCDPRFIVNRN